MDGLLELANSGPGVHWGALVAITLIVATLIVHVAFAVGVMAHANGRRTSFVGPLLWALATLLTGVLGAVAYWVVHCSRLARPEDGGVRTTVRRS